MTRRTFHAALGLGISAPPAAPQPPAAPRPAGRTLVDRLQFFDCDVIFGPRFFDAEKAIIDPPFLTADALLKELDHYRIREALVFHSAAKAQADPQANLTLVREIRGGAEARARLHPCWSIVPAPGGRMPEAASLLRDMRESGARAARVFPFNHQYRLENLGEILSALEERRVPLLLDYGIVNPHADRTDWNSVEWVLRSRPALDVILCHGPSRKNVPIFRMMELSRRFHLSPPGYRIHQEVHAMTRLFGPEALVYGSHLPFNTAAAPIAEVIYSELDEAEQKQIAGDNLRLLLAGVRL